MQTNSERQPLLQSSNLNNNQTQNNDATIDILDGALPALFNENTTTGSAANVDINLPTVDENFLIALNLDNFQEIRARIGTLFETRATPPTRLQVLIRNRNINIGLCALTFTLALLGLSGLIFTVGDSSGKTLRPSLEICTVAFVALMFVAMRRYAVSRDEVDTERNRVRIQPNQVAPALNQ